MKIFKSLKSQAEGFLDQYKSQNPATYAAAQQAVGGVLIADGLIGIDNPFGQDKRSGIIGAFFGIGVGILFMLIPFFVGHFMGTDKMTATTTATVVSVGPGSSTSSDDAEACPMTVSYSVNGDEYTKRSPISSSGQCGLSAGQKVEINYDPANPGAWVYDMKTLNLIINIFFWAGLIAAIASAFTFILRLLSIIFGWKILKAGRANAKGLPPGTDLNSIILEVKKNFMASIFNFPAPTMLGQFHNPVVPPQTGYAPPAQPSVPVQPPAPVAAPVQPPVSEVPPAQPTTPTAASVQPPAPATAPEQPPAPTAAPAPEVQSEQPEENKNNV